MEDFTFTEEYTAKLGKQLADKKDELIKERLIEKGFEHILSDSPTRRFKRIVVEKHPDYEHWYADNGTEEGVLIISFKNPGLPKGAYINNGQTFAATVEIEYK